MPHTNRKKRLTTSKRVEVTDENGWTSVTTTRALRRNQTPSQSTAASLVRSYADYKTVPEEGATPEKIQKKYLEIEAQWLNSPSCKALIRLLKDEAQMAATQVDHCVLFGSGSFCGLRQGWIKRDTAALSQLAVFKTIIATVGEYTTTTPRAYAQDPAYNHVDQSFLMSHGIDMTETPHGFELLSGKSLAYTPCAEMHVDVQVIRQKPAILLSGKLDWYWRNSKGQPRTNRVAVQHALGDSNAEQPEVIEKEIVGEEAADTMDPVHLNAKRVHMDKHEHKRTEELERECQALEDFLEGRRGTQLPDLEVKDYPFSNQHLYWLEVLQDKTA